MEEPKRTCCKLPVAARTFRNETVYRAQNFRHQWKNLLSVPVGGGAVSRPASNQKQTQPLS